MAAVTNILWLNGGYPQGIGSADTITAPGSWSFSGGPTAFTGNVSVGGSLDVSGDIISRDQVNVVIQDSFLDLGFGNTTATATPGGFTIQMNRNSGFTAGNVTDFPSTSTFVYDDATGSTLLVAGDVVVITGLPAALSANEGFFVVASVNQASFPQTVTIETSAVTSLPWAQTLLVQGTPASNGLAFQTDMSVLAVADGTSAFKDGSANPWPKGTLVLASITDATKALFQANNAYVAVGAGSTTLQNAYDNGQTINVTSGALTFTLTSADFVVNGGNDVDIGFTGTDVATFKVGAGAVDIQATGAVDIDSSGGAISIGGDANAQAINVGTGAAARTITVGNSTTSTAIDILAGTGGVDVDTAGPVSLDSTGTASNLTLTANDAGTATLTIEVTNAGAGAGVLDINADNAITIDSSSAGVSIDGVTASNFTVTGAGEDLTLSSVGGSVVIQGTETVATAVTINGNTGAGGIDINGGSGGITIDTASGGAISLDAVGAASNFTVAASAGSQDLTLSVTGAYDSSVIITSAGTGADAIKLDATGATGGILVDAVSHIEINSSAGEIRIGNDNVAQDIKIGTAGARNLDIGSTAAGTLTIEADIIDIGQGYLGHNINIGLSNGGFANHVKIGANYEASTTSIYGTYTLIYGSAFTQFKSESGIGGVGVGCKNVSGSALVGGEAVTIKSNSVPAASNVPEVKLADANAAAVSERRVFGIVVSGGANNAAVKVATVPGTLTPADFDSAPAQADIGKPVYLSATAGKVTVTAPSNPGDAVVQVGFLVDSTLLGGLFYEIVLAPQFIGQIPS